MQNFLVFKYPYILNIVDTEIICIVCHIYKWLLRCYNDFTHEALQSRVKSTLKILRKGSDIAYSQTLYECNNTSITFIVGIMDTDGVVMKIN